MNTPLLTGQMNYFILMLIVAFLNGLVYFLPQYAAISSGACIPIVIFYLWKIWKHEKNVNLRSEFREIRLTQPKFALK